MHDALEPAAGLSRRAFTGLSGMGLLALATPVRWLRPRLETGAGLLGRISDPTVEIYRRPSFAEDKVKTLWRDDVVPLVAALIGDPVPEHNQVWYEVEGLGYVHSSGVQPVFEVPNHPRDEIPFGGLLVEVTLPFVDARWVPRSDAERAYRFYYATTHWVTGVSQDVSENKWYRIQDDKYDYRYYAPAEAFRPIPNSELSPISADVPAEEKRIHVDLQQQWVQCFEGDRQVFASKISSGRKFDDGSYWTPEGEFVTFRKRPSRHMASGNRATGYDLPGVPWVSYITEDGVSFHGTFWHNDYGNPRSHGCLNMTPEAAKWLYRWTQPVVPDDEEELWVSYGTQVHVFAS